MLDELRRVLGLDSAAPNPLVEDSIVAVIAIVVLVLIGRLLRRMAIRYVDDPLRLNRINRLIRRIVALLSVLIVANIFVKGVGDVLTVLTIVGAGLAIALREGLMSVAAWAYNSLLSLYKIGDRIEIKGISGDVVDIRLMQTTVMEIREWVAADQSTGRLLHFPNSWIFLHAVKNFSRGFRFVWNEIPITVTYSSDWQKARDLIRDIAQEYSRDTVELARKELVGVQHEYLVSYSVLTPYVYTTIADSGVLLTLRYLCDYKARRGSAHALSQKILRAFHEDPTLDFAYPSQTIYAITPDQQAPGKRP